MYLYLTCLCTCKKPAKLAFWVSYFVRCVKCYEFGLELFPETICVATCTCCLSCGDSDNPTANTQMYMYCILCSTRVHSEFWNLILVTPSHWQ